MTPTITWIFLTAGVLYTGLVLMIGFHLGYHSAVTDSDPEGRR